MIRIALLGAGAMGAMHAHAWSQVPGVELAGILGRTEARVQALAALHGVRASTDPRVFLEDPRIDAVDVTVPTALHRELVTAALASGKHVFCETPLAPAVEDADAIIAAARAHGRHLQVALLARVAEPGVRACDWIRSGRFGRPLVASFERLWPGLAQLDDPANHHGDALEEVSLFDFDFALWCFGMPRTATVVARGAGRQSIAHALTLLDHDDVTVAVEASEALPPSAPFRLAARIVCAEGTLEWTARFDTTGPPQLEMMSYPRAGEPERIPPVLANPYETECRRFVAVLRGEADPGLLGADAARDGLRVVAAARASLRSGGPVAVA